MMLGMLVVMGMLSLAPQITFAQSFPTGGTITQYTSGGSTYRVHTFNGDGTFSIPADTPIASFDYLVVGGGGSGAIGYGDGGIGKTSCRGLGGGAGGQVLTGSSNSLTGNIGVVVGAGGATISAIFGNNGNPSSFGAIQATGGGGAGRPSDASLFTGGGGTYGQSFGNSSMPSLPPGNGSGYDGGATAGASQNPIAAGGGAGAGGDGGNAPSLSQGGNGGIGVESTITGTSVYYGGGGGGGACGTSGAKVSGGAGGLGGGGDALSVGTNGLGGGGGGGINNGGGRGVVFVAYKLPPTVTDVTSSAANEHYLTGASIDVRVTFSELVTVTGSPTLTLETGTTDRTATFVSGSGSSTLVFSYSVQAGDTAADLDYVSTVALSLNGGTIKSSADSSDAFLTLPSPGATGSLGANKAIVIDTTAPVVTDAGISLSGASGSNGAFIAGDTITASWETSGSDGDTNITSTLGGATVDFSAFGGANNVAATPSGTKWTATYKIVANTSTSGSNLNVSVTATDEAGNSTTAVDTTNATVDATPPGVSASNISLSGASGTGGAFKIGDTVTATWDNTDSGDDNGDIASVSVDFTEFGGGSDVTASNSSGTWTATYTIVVGSIDQTSRNVTVTAIDTAGNSTSQAGSDDESVDNVAPTVTAGAISVSGQTGNPKNSVFKIGDTVTVTWDDTGAGDNNPDTISSVSVDFTDFGGGEAVSATNSSGVWTATYLYDAGSVAGSTFGVSVTVVDNAGNTTKTNDDEQLSLDNVATPAPSAITLDTADNTGSTSDMITSETKPSIGGTSEPNATIDVYVAGTFVGQTTADGTGAWSYTFTADLAEGANSITTTATDAVGNTSDPSTPLSITIDTTPPAQPPAPVLDPAGNTGNGSDLITFDTTPSVSGTAEPNSTVEIFVGGVSVGTAIADGNGDWSFAIPDGSLAEGDNAITLTSSDVAGNTSTASDALTITLDTIDPTIAITNLLMGDNLFNAAEATAVTLSGTTTDVDDGQTVTLTVSDGTTTLPFTTTVSSNAWTTTVDLSSLSDGELTITADVTDVAGNAATQASHTITKDVVFPTTQVTGPTEIVTAAFDVTITFSKVVTGLELSEILVTEGTAIALSGSGANYTATIDPVLGKFVQVSIAAGSANDTAGNPNIVSNVFEVQAGSPASEFEKYTDEIRQVIVDDAERSLQSALATNRRMVQGARTRFIASQEQQAACSENEEATSTDKACVDVASRNNVAFDVDGTAQVSGTTLSTSGTFFGQTGNFDGTSRRLVFGDFDVQHDGDTGSSTATITGRVAWEWMTSDTTMLGYFIGGELAHSSIAGAFDGDQDRLGVTVGGYAVHQLSEQLYADGYFSLGAGRNNLDMANDVLALTSDYTTQTATIGGALSGVYEYGQFELRPELAFSYGKTWIGKVGFTGRAYGLVDDTLSLDAGNVSIANLTLRPEVIWALDGKTVADSNSQLSFAPRLICEQVKTVGTTENCGGGAEIGLSSTSDDGLSNAEFRVIMDRVGGTTRSSFGFNLERQF